MRLLLVLFLLLFISISAQEVIIDCNYTLSESLNGIKIPKEIKKQLVLINVEYYSFDKKLHMGQLLINSKVENEIKEIFNNIKKSKFPVNKVIPIVFYNWDDELSMNDNNTSAFNYRFVKGTKVLSKHSLGMAIDINPMYNPQLKGKSFYPKNSNYDPNVNGTITKQNAFYKLFIKYGWKWGGGWRHKDYQHFEK